MPRIRRASDWFGRRPMVADVVWAIIIAPFTVLNTILYLHDSASSSSVLAVWWGVAWGLSYVIPLIWRRTRPLLAFGLVIPAHVIQFLMTTNITFGNISAVMMLYAVARYSSKKMAKLCLWGGLAASIAAGFRWSPFVDSQFNWTEAVFTGIALAAVSAVSWLLGAFSRERNASIWALQDRADALEKERDQSAQLAAEQERSRISREMHDVVAHSLSVIVVQTDGLRYILDQPGAPEKKIEAARKALDSVSQTAHDALAETRALVGVLREGEDIEMAPQPKVNDILGLVERTSVSGLQVDLILEGDAELHSPLSPQQETAAYRIVQEALTNVIKHAGNDARAWVRVQHDSGGLTLSVRDNGLGAYDDDGHGHGLIGMRERVAPSGGTFDAHNRLDGGFEIVASLPTKSILPRPVAQKFTERRKNND